MESEPAAGKAGDGDGPEFSVTSGLVTASASRRRTAAVVLLAAAGAGLVLVSTAKYGAGISPDSAVYLDVARNLVSGKGFVSHTGEPLVWWPPLYPMLLALIGLATRLDPAACAHLANATLFALVICLSARLLQTGSPQTTTYRVLGVCAVLFSIPLSEVYAMVWSECLFIPLVLLYLVFAQRYWVGGDVLSLAIMTSSTALACLTRYAGIALAAAGVVTIVLATVVGFKTRVTRAFAFAVLSLVPLGLWGARNYRLTGTLFGDRGPLQKTLTDNVIVSAETILSWYASGLVLTLVALAGIAVLTISVLSSSTARSRLTRGLKAIISDHPPAVLFLVGFITMLLVAAARDVGIDSRMLSPVYVPATLILLAFAARLLSPTQPRAAAFSNRAPSVLLVLWLCFPFASVARSTIGRLRNGAGFYNTDTWRKSETVAYAKQMLSNNDDVRVYSNGPDALWELADVNATLLSRKAYCGSTRSVNKHGDLIRRWPPEDKAYLVWFKKIHRPHLFTAEGLEEIANIVEVAHLSDGSVYRISVRDTAAPD